MWVFDGEEWSEEGQPSESKVKPARPEMPEEFYYPELQLEIVEIPTRHIEREVPPLPFP